MKGSVRLRGKKWSYYFNYKDEFGKTRKKEKGGFATKKAAESALRKAIVNFEESNFIEKNTYTLNDSIEYWFEHVGDSRLRYNTKKSYRSIWKNHIQESIGMLQESKLTPAILQAHFTKKSKEVSKSLGTIRNVINNSLNLAVKHQRIKQNPMRLIENVSSKSDKITPNTPEEIQLIDNYLKNTLHHPSFVIALHTGMRRGEVLGVGWHEIDFENNIIDVNEQLQKQDGELVLVPLKTDASDRIFLMTAFLRDYLLALREEQLEREAFYGEHYYKGHSFVCCHADGRPISPDALSSKMIRVSKELSIDFNFHRLRHTHATMMLEADANIKVLQERLGHAKIDTLLNTYSHVTKKLEDQALEKFNSFFKT